MDNPERIKAVVSAIVIIAINVGVLFGFDIDGDAMTNALLGLAAFASWCYAIWKNHNFTDEAISAQQYLDELKALHRGM